MQKCKTEYFSCKLEKKQQITTNRNKNQTQINNKPFK